MFSLLDPSSRPSMELKFLIITTFKIDYSFSFGVVNKRSRPGARQRRGRTGCWNLGDLDLRICASRPGGPSPSEDWSCLTGTANGERGKDDELGMAS
jgi:hypothetical protein